jgi:hypothetical protein
MSDRLLINDATETSRSELNSICDGRELDLALSINRYFRQSGA